MTLNEDFTDLLDALDETGADYVVVGAHAMAAHGVPRATGDLDVLVRASQENAQAVFRALLLFGAPIEQHHIDSDDFAHPGDVYQMGLPPRRIDILTSIDGVSFEQVWSNRVVTRYEGRSVPVIGVRELVDNKRACGRPKDLLDLELLATAGLMRRDRPTE